MVQYSDIHQKQQYNSNCITGDKDHLYQRLKESILRAEKVDIIVAFLMESGVKLLKEDLAEAVNRGTAIRILCGNYLNITQPQALYLLKDSLGDKVDLRFYNVPKKSFHPKAYIFEYEDSGDIFIGSSNVSKSALTNGIEWNYRISSKANLEDFSHFKETFEELFLNNSIIVDDNEMRRYSKSWRRPSLLEDLERVEDEENKQSAATYLKSAEIQPGYVANADGCGTCKIVDFFHPRGAQIEALYELKKSKLEGWDKGIVVAATGVGKTFLAAFDSRNHDKILFVAHKEEILYQAETSFKCVRTGKKTGFFTGDRKDKDYDILFATVQTIGREEYLNEAHFARNEFEYIVIDEFHHAVANSYRNVIDYFKPKFMLGLTATPERLDSQDVFALCDYNLVYEVRLKEAINKGWLVPFRYYGVYDDTDYSNIRCKNGRYDEKQLEEALSAGRRSDLILKHYGKHNSQKALGFCSNRGHALYIAKYFSEHGIKACAVISGTAFENGQAQVNNKNVAYALDRKSAVQKLKNGEINIIFSVDIFNEGLDVPEVDMVMFLRPTESPTVFLQQLGRGLRRSGKKKYVNVLDFIGNYKKANLIPFFLTGEPRNAPTARKPVLIPEEEEYPDGCIVDFDLAIIDLFKKMREEQKSIFEKVVEEYNRIKDELGAKPLRLQMYTYMDGDIYYAIRNKKELNIFKDYIGFLEKAGGLEESEKELVGTVAHSFLIEVENTSMIKTYKMPVLLAFYNNGNLKSNIDENDIYENFKEFYSHSANSIDLLRDASSKNYRAWGKKEYVSLARRNPIHFLARTSPNFFYEKDGKFCILSELEEFFSNPAFVKHFKDVIDYRSRRFYKERLEQRLTSINEY